MPSLSTGKPSHLRKSADPSQRGNWSDSESSEDDSFDKSYDDFDSNRRNSTDRPKYKAKHNGDWNYQHGDDVFNLRER